MNTRIISINPSAFLDEELSLAGKTIASGGLVAFPTETVYGLGASALSGDACDRVFFAKGRPHDNPLIVHVLDPDDCQKYATIHEKSLFYTLADRFMPGPLTIVLPKKDIIPNSVTVGLSTVALRCPSHPIARALIRVSKVPIAAPSANLSGKPSPTVAEHVISDMNGRIDMILDGGPCQVGLESTVIALKGDAIHLLRPGYVTAEDLLSVTDNVVVSPAVLASLAPGDNPESPGMKYRHYAPSSPVRRTTRALDLSWQRRIFSASLLFPQISPDLAPSCKRMVERWLATPPQAYWRVCICLKTVRFRL